jgi:hypothetical protein
MASEGLTGLSPPRALWWRRIADCSGKRLTPSCYSRSACALVAHATSLSLSPWKRPITPRRCRWRALGILQSQGKGWCASWHCIHHTGNTHTSGASLGEQTQIIGVRQQDGTRTQSIMCNARDGGFLSLSLSLCVVDPSPKLWTRLVPTSLVLFLLAHKLASATSGWLTPLTRRTPRGCGLWPLSRHAPAL